MKLRVKKKVVTNLNVTLTEADEMILHTFGNGWLDENENDSHLEDSHLEDSQLEDSQLEDSQVEDKHHVRGACRHMGTHFEDNHKEEL